MPAPSSSALWNGTEISQISTLLFSGSSSVTTSTLPRCVGAILRPSGEAERTLTLQGQYLVGGQSKAVIEESQKNLGTFLSCTATGTLVVHGNTYTNLTPKSLTFENIIHNGYMVFTIEFELAHNSRALNSQILPTSGTTGARSATFNYTHGDINQSLSTFNFPIYHNVDLTIDTSWNLLKESRAVRSEGGSNRISGGEHRFTLNGWITDTSVNDIESYLYNFIMSIGPLGKKGTLTLGGVEYDNSIMTEFSSETYKGGDDNGVKGTSVSYQIGFARGVC